jgi:hypothetical protein
MTRGRHQLEFGAWFQQFQSNETIALSQYGQATFTSLQTFLKGTVSSFLFDPAPTELNWRSLLGAWFVQDTFRIRPRLTVTLGFRDEFTTGWNEAHSRASNYTFSNGIISTDPSIGTALFTVNNAKFLPQPRVAVAWSPFNDHTVVRAGFGMYNDLQDALGYRADQNADFLFVESAAAAFAEYLANGGICRQSWVPRNYRDRCEPTFSCDLSGSAVPGNISRNFSRRRSRHAGAGGHVLRADDNES